MLFMVPLGPPSARPVAQALRLPFEYYLLENATALGSWIPLHAVLLHVNNTPVKLKIRFAI